MSGERHHSPLVVMTGDLPCHHQLLFCQWFGSGTVPGALSNSGEGQTLSKGGDTDFKNQLFLSDLKKILNKCGRKGEEGEGGWGGGCRSRPPLYCTAQIKTVPPLYCTKLLLNHHYKLIYCFWALRRDEEIQGKMFFFWRSRSSNIWCRFLSTENFFYFHNASQWSRAFSLRDRVTGVLSSGFAALEINMGCIHLSEMHAFTSYIY